MARLWQENQLTGEGLDILQVLAGTGLQLNGAGSASRAASEGEGEGLANLDIERDVGDGRLGKSDGSKGRDSSSRVLHFESVKGRLKN